MTNPEALKCSILNPNDLSIVFRTGTPWDCKATNQLLPEVKIGHSKDYIFTDFKS